MRTVGPGDVQRPKDRGGMGSHHSADMKRDEWLTPPWVLFALGPFDLDPCAPVGAPWATARHHYNIHDNGLSQPWFGRVWLNPPYGAEAQKWMRRLAEHGQGTALIFARTETSLFFPWVWDYADAILFFKGRLNFHFIDGRRAETNSGAPSVLIAYGERDAQLLAESGIEGKLLRIPRGERDSAQQAMVLA